MQDLRFADSCSTPLAKKGTKAVTPWAYDLMGRAFGAVGCRLVLHFATVPSSADCPNFHCGQHEAARLFGSPARRHAEGSASTIPSSRAGGREYTKSAVVESMGAHSTRRSWAKGQTTRQLTRPSSRTSEQIRSHGKTRRGVMTHPFFSTLRSLPAIAALRSSAALGLAWLAIAF